MSTYTYEQLIEKLRLKNFPNAESAQQYLKDLEASVVLAIRVTRGVFGISMGQAKQVVDNHPIWKNDASVGRDLQNVAIEVARTFQIEEKPESEVQHKRSDSTRFT